MTKNLWLIITTINKPAQAVVEYSKIAARMGWKLLIVGDVKTPNGFQDIDCIFLPLDAQRKFRGGFANLVPLNHYSRKNLGYLYAIENGAEWIFDSDDDNCPLQNFVENIVSARRAKLLSGHAFVNVYKHFSDELVWPRGLPLPSIRRSGEVVGETQERHFPVRQFLADKDPDVDAIYRLTNNREIWFRKDAPAVFLTPGTWSPFNSQATLFHRRYFRTLYLPCYVPFRMTDIWRSFVAQKILWADGEGVAFIGPTVIQERNVHDYFRDFQDEILGYLHNQEICNVLEQKTDTGISFGDILLRCYSDVQKVGVVEPRELAVVKEWNSILDTFDVA